MSVYKNYTNKLREEFAYLAVWFPNTKLKLGDVGILKRDSFTPIGSLDNLGIKFETTTVGPPMSYNFQSKNEIDISFGAGASSLGVDSSANVRVAFKAENAIVFIAKGGRSTCIKDQLSLSTEIVNLYKDGIWDIHHVVVTELVTVDSATILVSNTNDAEVEMEAKTDLKIEEINLADSKVKFDVKKSKGLAFSAIGEVKLTPLLKASGIKKPFIGSPSFNIREIRTDSPGEVFGDLDYSDLEGR